MISLVFRFALIAIFMTPNYLSYAASSTLPTKQTKPSRSPTPTAATTKSKVVFLGDSITEGYGIQKSEAFPSRVEVILSSSKTPIEAVNAGISGSTSASGPKRLDWLLKSKPKLLLIELGANDGLRGQKPEGIAENLAKMISSAQKANVKVLFIAMKLPPNYGADYRKAFAKVFADTSKKYNVELIPFLDEFFARQGLMQGDGLHPNAKGHQLIAESLAPIISRNL